MLKGLKKSKPNQVNNDQKMQMQQQINQQFQHNDPQIKVLVSKQKNLKNQYVIEEYNEPIQELEQQLKSKAFQVLRFFQLGHQHELTLRKKMSEFEKIQQKLINSTTNNIHQTIISKQKIEKGKFQYNIKFQQEEQEAAQKSSKKRKHPKIISQKIQQYCIFCPDNEQLQLISASNYVYLALGKKKTFKKYQHFILAPVEHHQSTIGLNDDVLTEISNYKKCLLQMFDKKNCLVVFFQQFSQENSHIYIECLAVPYSKGQDFPFFFKQGLQTVEGNWTTHKNIIKIQKEKGGLQKQIPKKMKYFYIDFSLGYGYAHVIENEKFWKRDFVYEILATALGIELYEVKTAAEFTDEEIEQKHSEFKKMWEPFDWTKCI